MSKELKRCPFCGGEAEIIKDDRYPRNRNIPIKAFHVECKKYGCPIYNADTTYFRTRKEALEKWNSRILEVQDE